MATPKVQELPTKDSHILAQMVDSFYAASTPSGLALRDPARSIGQN